MRRSNGQNGKENCLLLLACLLLVACQLDLRGEGCSNIYYYTPLPLNLANNKQQQHQATTRLLAVLAIAPSQGFGSFAHVAILEPSWWPCQILVLS